MHKARRIRNREEYNASCIELLVQSQDGIGADVIVSLEGADDEDGFVADWL